MDIRLFKALILFGVEAVLFAAYYVEGRFFAGSRVGDFIYDITLYTMYTFPVLVLLPEDNWIWLVEEDPRGRKITLRSKASKHLNLSMLYFAALGYPGFLVCLTLFHRWPKYHFAPAWWLIGYGVLYGIYCAHKNFRNVKKFDALFAVAWDRRSTFVEIFVGVKVAQNMRFFYKGFALFMGVIYILGSMAIAPLYYKWIKPPGFIVDPERFLMMQSVYCFLLAFSVWVMSMYISFQLLFSRKMEQWVREKK